MKKFLSVCILFFMIAPAQSQIDQSNNYGNCLNTLYAEPQEKKLACIDVRLKAIPPLEDSDALDSDIIMSNAPLLGVFSILLQSSPELKKEILARGQSVTAKLAILYGLNSADLQSEAQAYAQHNNLETLQKKIETKNIPLLKDIHPIDTPMENDIDIGAYSASGDPLYIKNILANYSSATDVIARDGLKLGLLYVKFGEDAAPAFRHVRIFRNLCVKYDCKKDSRKMMRVMTLGTAYWALESLGRKDETVKKTMQDFFSGDPRLNAMLASEKAALSNYLTTLAAWSVKKDDPAISESLSIYENFGAPQETFEAKRKMQGDQKQ